MTIAVSLSFLHRQCACPVRKKSSVCNPGNKQPVRVCGARSLFVCVFVCVSEYRPIFVFWCWHQIVMFSVLVLCLSILVTNRHVMGSRLKHRQTDIPAPSEKTLIILEFAHQAPEEVFLVGGFTNGNPDQCADAEPPCSIPISHSDRFDSVEGYNSWKIGDNYLDWDGAEPGQGKFNDVEARGTPMVWMQNASEVLQMANSKRQLHMSKFWVVELVMDCTHSNGIFEVKALPKFPVAATEPSSNKMRQLRDREFDPQRFAGFISRFKSSPDANIDHEGKFVIPGLEGYFNDKSREELGTAMNPRSHRRDSRPVSKPIRTRTAKVFKRSATRVYTAGRRRQRFEQFPCTGEYKFEAPFNPDNRVHIGVCGYANILLYNTHECEVNGI